MRRSASAFEPLEAWQFAGLFAAANARQATKPLIIPIEFRIPMFVKDLDCMACSSGLKA